VTTGVERLSKALADRYSIERELGKGGMATVYLAEDIRHGRKVAVKVVLPELAAILGAERFLSEIHVTAQLQHPNILPLFDSGQADGQLFYVMPYVEGESLRQKLNRERQLPVDEALMIGKEVASALDYAHRKGVIHRDIKPENILLHDGHALVADFGIALAVTSAGGGRLTQTGLSLGTPQYMSPEQATAEREIDARSDVYSLATVIYEMFCGEPPHTGSTMQAVIARLLTERPRNVRLLRPNVPAHVAAALDRALEKIPADRWHSAREFSDALDGKILAAGRTPAEPAKPRALVSTRVISGLRQRVTDPVTLALAAVTIAAVAFGARGFYRERSEAVPPTIRFPLTLSSTTALSLGNSQQAVAMSPDGGTIAFIGRDKDANQQVFVRTLADAHVRPIPGTELAYHAFFSPDAKWLTFATSAGDLKKVSLDGGALLNLARLTGIYGGGSWSTRGEIVVSMGGTGLLYSIPENGGAPRRVCKQYPKAAPIYEFGPVVLDDGETVLFTGGDASKVSANRIAVGSLSTGKCSVLDVQAAEVLGVVDGLVIYVTAAGALMAAPFDVAHRRITGSAVPALTDIEVNQTTGAAQASISRNGSLIYLPAASPVQIVSSDMHGTTQPLVQDVRTYTYPRLSPDGTKLAVAVTGAGQKDVWVVDLASGTASRVTADGSVNERPEWTPDGKRLLYRSSRMRRSAIWWRAADLSDAESPLVANEKADLYEGVISPDGSAIAYQLDTAGADIYYRQLSGDTVPKPVAVTQFTETQPRISPDGHWIAYVTDESGADQVVVQPFPGPGSRMQVSVRGGKEPVWSRDGQRLFYRDFQNFVAANVRTSPTFSVLSRETLFADSFVPASLPHANYDVTPDGEHLVLLKPTQSAEATIVYNWIGELRKKLRGQNQN
jgi:serine/threonine-protein kinase